MNVSRDQTVALAGIFQAAALVKALAWHGNCDADSTASCINSIFKIDAASVTEVFGGVEHVKLGLQELIALFNNTNNNKPNTKKSQEIARYTLSLIHLERRLMKQAKLLPIISQGIVRAENQVKHFSLLHENVMANLAGIYTDTLSTFNFRIHVIGNQNYLTNTANANKIRALLLAGIRAAVLWRQVGGSRWQLMLARKQYINTAKQLLAAPELLVAKAESIEY